MSSGNITVSQTTARIWTKIIKIQRKKMHPDNHKYPIFFHHTFNWLQYECVTIDKIIRCDV